MRRATLLDIAREGWYCILLTLVLAYLAAHFVALWLGIVFLLIAAFLALFFRDPPRVSPSEPLAVIVPADGRIVYRRECYDPFLDREAIRVSIDLALLGAYLLRSPAEGTVLELAGAAGVDGVASWVRTDEGDEIIVVVTRGTLLGKRPIQARYGERVGQGRRCGPRRLARSIDIYLPAAARVEIAADKRVYAGSDVLATLIRKENGQPNTHAVS